MMMIVRIRHLDANIARVVSLISGTTSSPDSFELNEFYSKTVPLNNPSTYTGVFQHHHCLQKNTITDLLHISNHIFYNLYQKSYSDFIYHITYKTYTRTHLFNNHIRE